MGGRGDAVGIGVVVRVCGADGSEIFFRDHPHVAIGIGIDGGFDEISLVAMPLATRNDASTFLLARFEETQHAVELLVRNERSHVVALVEARTDLDLLRAIRNRSEYLVERRLVYIETEIGRASCRARVGKYV